jgi:membrane fusion protein, heavy metal efflux system
MRNRNTFLQIFLLVAFPALTVWMTACDTESHGSQKLAQSENSAQEDSESHDGHENCPSAAKKDDHEDQEAKHDNHDHSAHATEKDDHEDKDTKPEVRDEYGEDSHAGHGHGEEGSDLDKSIEELFAADCEHKLKTHQCDECRYEVGVVKVAPELIDRGLISVAKVSRRNFDSEIGLTGEIRFDKQKIALLGPSVAGVVRNVKVDIGDKAKAGQTLVILESVELAEAQAIFLEALAEQNLARKSHDRQKALHEQKINSEKDYLEAEQQFESAKIRTSSAKQKLLRMGLSSGTVLALAQKGFSAATGRLPVSAPFDGEVLEVHAVRGERVEPGAETILFGDISTLWVWIDLYESQLAAVKASMTDEGLPVTVSVHAWPDEHFSGKMDYISNMMEEATRTIKVRVILDNPQGKLKPGMFAKVALGLNSSDGRIAAPTTSVVSDQGRDFVFVRHEGDFFARRPVTKGRQTDGYFELLDGVEEGQTIVMAGAFLLKSDVLRSKMGAGCAH